MERKRGEAGDGGGGGRGEVVINIHMQESAVVCKILENGIAVLCLLTENLDTATLYQSLHCNTVLMQSFRCQQPLPVATLTNQREMLVAAKAHSSQSLMWKPDAWHNPTFHVTFTGLKKKQTKKQTPCIRLLQTFTHIDVKQNDRYEEENARTCAVSSIFFFPVQMKPLSSHWSCLARHTALLLGLIKMASTSQNHQNQRLQSVYWRVRVTPDA